MLLLFHNVFGTGDPVKDVILLIIILTLFVTCNVSIFYGIVYMVRYWHDFDSRWKKVLLLAPAVILLATPASPIHLGWLSFPFAIFAGFPVLFFLDTGEPLGYFLVGGIGIIFNVIGFIGLLRYIEKRSERRRNLC